MQASLRGTAHGTWAGAGSARPGSRPVERRKLRKMRWPNWDAMLSGWNCTLVIGCVRWARPMIRPSSLSAVISRSVGQGRRARPPGNDSAWPEGARHAGEHRVAGVSDRADLAVHGLRRAHDLAAERLADGLVAEADAEACGIFAGGSLDQRQADAGPVRIAGAGRQDDARGAWCSTSSTAILSLR